MKKDLGRIGVLLGGPSNEREISIRSGKTVYEAITSLGLDAVCIDIKHRPSAECDISRANIDVAFIALHGRFGEDGTIQAILEEMGIPYTGSGPNASRLALNKILSRQIFEKHDIPVPCWLHLKKQSGDNGAKRLCGQVPLSRNYFMGPVHISQGTWPHKLRSALERFSPPFVVKPANEGSSIGMTIVENEAGLESAVDTAFSYDDEILIEEYVPGEDITVGILNDKPLPVCHIKTKLDFYNYEAKYTNGMSEYIVPADLEKEITIEAQRLGFLAHKVLGCRSFSRVDMLLDKEKDRVVVLEVNSIPGLTSSSLLPKAASAAGIDFTRMCINMIESALIGV